MNAPLVTLSLFRYRGFSHKVWAFTMMGLARPYLREVPGLRFHKILGTGAGRGFKWYSDFSTYALLTVWDTMEQAERFLRSSELHQEYRRHCAERFTVFMSPLRSRGRWNGANPFSPVEAPDHGTDPVSPGQSSGRERSGYTAVITRATISTRRLLTFWRQVPRTSGAVWDYPGLIYAKGIGEWPVKEMATFSLWEDEESMKAYAYKDLRHVEAMRKTRELEWYDEELFARFEPFKSEGTWDGAPLLPF